jgi:hypothetical protein
MDPRVNGRRLEQVVSLQETRARVVPKKIGIMPSVLVAPLVFSVGRVESPGGLRGGLDSYIRWGIHSTGRACWNAWPGWKHDSRVAGTPGLGGTGSVAGNPGLNTWRCRLPESNPFSGRALRSNHVDLSIEIGVLPSTTASPPRPGIRPIAFTDCHELSRPF